MEKDIKIDDAEIKEDNPEEIKNAETVVEEESIEQAAEKVENSSFMKKLQMRMKAVYEKAVDKKTYSDAFEKIKSVDKDDVKQFLTKNRENLIVSKGGETAYKTFSTLTGVKAITDWSLYGLSKLGQSKIMKKSGMKFETSMRGDVYKYFAENGMERALLGITNNAIELRKSTENKKAEEGSKEKEKYSQSKKELIESTKDFKDKVEKINVSDDRKKELKRELALIMKDHKFKEAELHKNQSEQFDNVMRNYTGAKVSSFKLGKDVLNSALTFSGFSALRGASYVGFSALERGKKDWDKYSRKTFTEKQQEEGKDAEWKSSYNELSGDKFKGILKGITIDATNETVKEIVLGDKNRDWQQTDEEKQAKTRNKQKKLLSKYKEINELKNKLDEEGKGVFGKTWRVKWHEIKNAEFFEPENLKKNLVRLQAAGQVFRIGGLSATGVSAYATDGDMFKTSFNNLTENINDKGVMVTAQDNLFSKAERYEKLESNESVSKVTKKIIMPEEDSTDKTEPVKPPQQEAVAGKATLKQVNVEIRQAKDGEVANMHKEVEDIVNKGEQELQDAEQTPLKIKTFSLELGKGEVPAQLERTFQMIALNNMENVLGDDIKFGEEEGAKSLNVAANLVRLAEGKDTLGIKANGLNDVFTWNKDTNTLDIKDNAKLKVLLDKLNSNADKLWEKDVLQKEAVGYLKNLNRKTIKNILYANGLEDHVDGHDDITDEQIVNFQESDMVKEAHERINARIKEAEVIEQKATEPKVEVASETVVEFKKPELSEGRDTSELKLKSKIRGAFNDHETRTMFFPKVYEDQETGDKYITDHRGRAIPSDEWNRYYIEYPNQLSLENSRVKFEVNAVSKDINIDKVQVLDKLKNIRKREIIKLLDGRVGIKYADKIFVPTEKKGVFIEYVDGKATEFFDHDTFGKETTLAEKKLNEIIKNQARGEIKDVDLSEVVTSSLPDNKKTSSLPE